MTLTNETFHYNRLDCASGDFHFRSVYITPKITANEPSMVRGGRGMYTDLLIGNRSREF